MASTQQSPGVEYSEKDASLITTGASTSVGGTVGLFQWGPVMVPMLIDNESSIVSTFGKPDDNTFSYFFAAKNFLDYTSAMWITRADTTGNLNATSSGTGLKINNNDVYQASYSNGEGAVGEFAARYPGVAGNSILVSYADASSFTNWAYSAYFNSAPGTSDYAASKGGSNDELHVVVVDKNGIFSGTPGTILEKYAFVSKASDALSYQGINNFYGSVLHNNSSYVYWMDVPVAGTNWNTSCINKAFTNASVAVAIGDADWVGNVATLTFSTTTAPVVGSTIVVSGITPAVYNGTFVVTASSTTSVSYALVGTGIVSSTVAGTFTTAGGVLSGGVNDNAYDAAKVKLAWDLFTDSETYDISAFVTGNANTELAQYVQDNIVLFRKDAVGFSTIVKSDGSPIVKSSEPRLADSLAYKTSINSDYMFVTSAYKYTYDKYNDKYRWVADNSDIAGLSAQVDKTHDTWISPGGHTKGKLRNVIKLSWSPNKSERDYLYKLSINPVITIKGEGTLLYGDKTATTKPSAFGSLPIRKLFLYLEKTISASAKYQLFEQNDAITRQQFVSTIEPVLRTALGRRGIEAYQIICDETNNTPAVRAAHEFKGSILVKPLYSINFIDLTFTAVGPDVTFEVAAQV